MQRKAPPLTGVGHAAADGWQVLALPLLHLLLHLVDFGRVQSPQAALARRAARLVLHLLEALVEGQVVSDRVLPAVRRSLSAQQEQSVGQIQYLNRNTYCVEVWGHTYVQSHI